MVPYRILVRRIWKDGRPSPLVFEYKFNRPYIWFRKVGGSLKRKSEYKIDFAIIVKWKMSNKNKFIYLLLM